MEVFEELYVLDPLAQSRPRQHGWTGTRPGRGRTRAAVDLQSLAPIHDTAQLPARACRRPAPHHCTGTQHSRQAAGDGCDLSITISVGYRRGDPGYGSFNGGNWRRNFGRLVVFAKQIFAPLVSKGEQISPI